MTTQSGAVPRRFDHQGIATGSGLRQVWEARGRHDVPHQRTEACGNPDMSSTVDSPVPPALVLPSLPGVDATTVPQGTYDDREIRKKWIYP